MRTSGNSIRPSAERRGNPSAPPVTPREHGISIRFRHRANDLASPAPPLSAASRTDIADAIAAARGPLGCASLCYSGVSRKNVMTETVAHLHADHMPQGAELTLEVLDEASD